MVAISLYPRLCLLILLSLLHPGIMVLPSQQEVNQVILCGEIGLSDYTAVEVGKFDNRTGVPPLPPCVTDCPVGTVAASTSCVIPEIQQTHGVRFNFALKFTCTALDGCPWLSGGASTQAMFIRVCQWLKIPEREVKAAHISFDASRAEDLRGIFIARQGESGYNHRRLSSSASQTSRVTFIAVRVDTKRLAAEDDVIKRILAYNATGVAWFLDMDVSLFNASLTLGLPAWGVDIWFQLIYGFTGEEWQWINIGKIDIPPGVGDSLPPTTVTTTALVTTTRTTATTTTLSGKVYDDTGSEEKATSEESEGSGLVPIIAVGCIALAVLLCFFVVFYSRLKRNQQFEDHGKHAAEHHVSAVKEATHRVRTRSKDFSQTSSDPKSSSMADVDLEEPLPNKFATDEATAKEPPSLAPRARKPPMPNAHAFRSKEQVPREPADKFTKSTSAADSEKVPTSGRSHYSSSPLMDPDVVGARTNGEPSSRSATQQEDRSFQRQNVPPEVERRPSKDKFSSRRDGAQSDRLGAQDDTYKTTTRDPKQSQSDGSLGASSQRTGVRSQSKTDAADPGISSQASAPQERRQQERKQQAPQPEVRRPASADNGATKAQGSQANSREAPSSSKQQAHKSSTETSLDDINLMDVDSITALETQMEAMRRAPFSQRKVFYHQQCLKWHPDKNPSDARTAQQVFQHLQTRKDWFLS